MSTPDDVAPDEPGDDDGLPDLPSHEGDVPKDEGDAGHDF